MSLLIRLWVVATIVACTYLVILTFEKAGYPSKFASSEFQVNMLPTEFDGWTSEPIEMDEWVIGRGDFRQIVNRLYRDSSGSSVRAHIATMRPLRSGKLPHMPEVCYRANGWVVVESSDFEADSALENRVTSRLVTF